MAAKKKVPNKMKAQSDIVDKITKRYRVTAREARDIVTAVANSGEMIGSKYNFGKSVKNIGRQVSETAKAAVTGKSGTTSDKSKSEYIGTKIIKNNTLIADTSKPEKYIKGKKRK